MSRLRVRAFFNAAMNTPATIATIARQMHRGTSHGMSRLDTAAGDPVPPRLKSCLSLKGQAGGACDGYFRRPARSSSLLMSLASSFMKLMWSFGFVVRLTPAQTGVLVVRS